ncbi:F0F1 ATP synthase subunit delta [Paenibacillus terrigena]|uniref:F0F1 ATP synthase subunit delta n=1 Tax=Paenibacillus terrigena TaxID=369333 RepID=UPI000377B2C2|nr:F0F1 ATP synthase subunit delta [Paenibacillus terrigena]
MSQDLVVAKRYAKALFEVAQQNNNIAQVEEDLKAVVAAIDGNVDITRFLNAPNIDLSVKVDVIHKAVEGKLAEAVISLISVLIKNSRQDTLGAVLQAYIKVAGEALGQDDAVVVSAYALSTPEIELVAGHFGKIVNKKIRVQNVVDKSIIGGIQVRIGDRLYDGSLSGKLARLEKSLK